jgi:hypothetical protein
MAVGVPKYVLHLLFLKRNKNAVNSETTEAIKGTSTDLESLEFQTFLCLFDKIYKQSNFN